MNDIQTKEDVANLVSTFYARVIPDPLIGHFFTEVVKLSWEKHIPLIVNFWSGILLGDSTYHNNVMEAHTKLNRKQKLEQVHFDRWIALWKETIVDNFSGPKAEEAIARAQTIAQFMMFRLSSGQ